MPDSIKTHRDFTVRYAAAIRRAAGAEVAVVGSYFPITQTLGTAGVTRVCDLTPLFYDLHIGVCEMTGAELAEVARKAAAEKDPQLFVYPSAGSKAGELEPARRYRVAMSVDVPWTFSGLAHLAPRNYQHTDLLVTDALDRFLVSE